MVRLHNEDRSPWLTHTPGQGHQVAGELLEIDDATLQAMDVFEEVGLPQGYVRVELELESIDDAGTLVRVYSHLRQEFQLAERLAIEGPFAECTRERAVGYWLEFTEQATPAQEPDLPPGR